MILGKPITLTNALGSTMAAFSLVRSNGTTGQMTLAQADTAAHAQVIGTCVEAPTNGTLGLVVPFGLATFMQFTGTPTVGNIAYLSGTAGMAQDSAPNGVIVPLGIVTKISSIAPTIALVTPWPSSNIVSPATRIMTATGALPAFSVVRATGVGDQIAGAQADTFAHSLDTFGVTLHATSGGPVLVAGPGGIVPIQFDGGGVIVSNLAWVSLTANQASSTPPAMSGTNQKLALGYILAASGSIGYVAFAPDQRPTPSNGIIGSSRFFFNWVFEGNPDPTGAAATWLGQSTFDAGPSTAIEFPIDEPITQIIVEGWLPTYGWGSSAPTLKLTKNGAVVATVYVLGSGGAGTVQFTTVVQSYARGDRLGLQLGSFGAGAIAGSSLFTGRVFVVP
jgi:hypothetical protein